MSETGPRKTHLKTALAPHRPVLARSSNAWWKSWRGCAARRLPVGPRTDLRFDQTVSLEETYEVLDAIDARDWAELAGELGDLLLQAVFFSQMASEQKLFSIENALDAINEKLIRRHPHIFGDETASTAGEVLNIWER